MPSGVELFVVYLMSELQTRSKGTEKFFSKIHLRFSFIGITECSLMNHIAECEETEVDSFCLTR